MRQPPVVLSALGSRAVFDPDDGFRLTDLELRGRPLLVTDSCGRGEMWWGSFVMAPWTSDLRDGRFEFLGEEHQVRRDGLPVVSHGVARAQAWSWDGERALCQFGPEWPFGGSVSLTPVLTPGRLQIHLKVTAESVAMPASVGWHPWFLRELDGAVGEVVLPAGSLRQHRDPAGMPTGRWLPADTGPFNDGIQTSDDIEVRWKGIGRIVMSSDGGHWIVFTANDHGICVEPLAAPAGAMEPLAAGEDRFLSFSVEWRPA